MVRREVEALREAMARADARAEKLTRPVVILAVAQFAVAVATLVVAIIALD